MSIKIEKKAVDLTKRELANFIIEQRDFRNDNSNNSNNN